MSKDDAILLPLLGAEIACELAASLDIEEKKARIHYKGVSLPLQVWVDL